MAFISNGTMSNLVVYNATMNNATLFNRSLYNETIHNGSLITTGASTRSQPIPSKLTAFSVVLVTMYIPFLLVAGIGNLLVILVRVKRFKQSGLSAYKQMICHLSLADIIYATAIPLDIYQRLKGKHWITNSGVCKLLRTTQSASLTASVCILTAMALERFQGISNPLAHHWSTKKVTIMAFVIWIYSYANFIPYAISLKVFEGECSDHAYPHADFAKWYTLYQFLTTWLIPLLLIIFFHFGMIVKVITHRKTIKRSTYHTTSSQTNGSSKQRPKGKRRKRKMVKILIVIVTLFALLTLPIHIWYLWYEFSDRSETEHYNLQILEIFATLVYLHSAVNPVIYSIMDKNFREDVKAFFKLAPRTHEEIRMRAINGATQESY